MVVLGGVRFLESEIPLCGHVLSAVACSKSETPRPFRMNATCSPALYTLHPAPYTLHLTPYTPHPAPYTLQPTSYTL